MPAAVGNVGDDAVRWAARGLATELTLTGEALAEALVATRERPGDAELYDAWSEALGANALAIAREALWHEVAVPFGVSARIFVTPGHVGAAWRVSTRVAGAGVHEECVPIPSPPATTAAMHVSTAIVIGAVHRAVEAAAAAATPDTAA